MNFKDFEKKAKCTYCDRPINIRQSPSRSIKIPGLVTALPFQNASKTSKQYRCECGMSKRIISTDGYTFTLPICNKYQIYINSAVPFFRVYLLECNDWNAKHPIIVYNVLVESKDIPNFIYLPRLKLIERLEEFLIFT
jgi:hypothetical protein